MDLEDFAVPTKEGAQPQIEVESGIQREEVTPTRAASEVGLKWGSVDSHSGNVILSYRQMLDDDWDELVESILDEKQNRYVIVVGPGRTFRDERAEAVREKILKAGGVWKNIAEGESEEVVKENLERLLTDIEDRLSVTLSEEVGTREF